MLKERGAKRAYKHNLRLAAVLSFVAGMVNICGLLSLNVLTTNVTGHFAFFAEAFFANNYAVALNCLLYIFCFLAGSFFSSLLIEIVAKIKPGLAYVVPIVAETIIIACVGVLITPAAAAQQEYPAMILLLLWGCKTRW